MMERFKVHPFNKRFIYWIVHFMDPIEDEQKKASSSFISSIPSDALPTNSNNIMNNRVADATP